jgi:hypothetical protein
LKKYIGKSKLIISLMLICCLLISIVGCQEINFEEKRSRVAGQIEITDEYGDTTYQIAIKEDGTINVQGTPSEDFIFDDWQDIVSVTVGDVNAGGIKSDGTVVATGYSGTGATDVKDWQDIAMIEFTLTSAYGLKKDGTIITSGEKHLDKIAIFERENMPLIKSLRNIVHIDANTFTLIVVKKNGRVAVIGVDESYIEDTAEWRDIKEVTVSNHSLAGLTYGGQVKITYDVFTKSQINSESHIVDSLEGSVKICVGDSFISGLMPDGTLRISEIDSFFTIDESILALDGEEDVIDINSHADTLVVMKRDGTIIVVGRDD